MKRSSIYYSKLFQIPHNFLGNPVNVLHGAQGRNFLFIEAAVGHAPEVPGKMLPGFQTGDFLAVILLGQLELLHGHQIALQEKQQKVFQQWLDKKIESMYVYISPEYRNGDFLNKSWVKKEMK